MANNYVHGKDGKAYVGATEICVNAWSVSDSVELLDINQTCDGGAMRRFPGLYGADISISGNWDMDASPNADPPNLVPGALVTNLKLQMTSSSYYFFPEAYVESSEVALDMGDIFKFNVNLKSNGAYTRPI